MTLRRSPIPIALWICGACLLSLPFVRADEPKSSKDKPTESKPAAPQPPTAAEMERAKQLLSKRQNGETLTADEEAFLRRIMEARRAAQGGNGAGSIPERLKAAGLDPQRATRLHQRHQSGEKLNDDDLDYLTKAYAALGMGKPGNPGQPNPGSGPSRALYGKDKIGFKPLMEMTAEDRYLGQDGGLYGGGKNEPPAAHLKAALTARDAIGPLGKDGKPDASGKIVLVSISMSNATQEFSRFKQVADADSRKSSSVAIVDCAQGGQAMAEWVDPQARPWQDAARRIEQAGVTPQQVQVAWIKLANKGPRGNLSEHGRQLQKDTVAVIHNAQQRFPNLRVVYLASRIYGGYGGSPLNPEPYAYEGAFAVRWLIQAQMQGDKELNYDAARGAVTAPVLLWGPYLWADGVNPRKSDGLLYVREDLAGDGTHPSDSGRQKVAELLLNFLVKDPLASTWFAK